MKLNLFKRLFLYFSSLLLILSTLIIILFYNNIRQFTIENNKTSLWNYADLMKLQASRLLFKYEKEKIILNKKIQNKIFNSYTFRTTLIYKNGIVIYDSDKPAFQLENHKSRPEIINALHNKKSYSIRFSKTLSQDMLYCSIPIYNVFIDNKRIKKKLPTYKINGVLRLSVAINYIDFAVKTLFNKFILLLILFLIISLLGAYIFSRKISKPIQEISEVANSIASGNFNVSINASHSKEFHTLIHSFEFMRKKIKSSIQEISLKHKELETIINSLENPLFIYDNNDKIILYNKAFQTLFPNSKNKDYWEVIYIPQKNKEAEIKIKNKN